MLRISRKTDDIIAGLVASIFLAGMILIVGAILIDIGKNVNKEYDHRFEVGDCVVLKVDGTEGMVTRVVSYTDILYVRFHADNTIQVNDFELDPC